MSVTKTDVQYAYRLLLGREPESETAVLAHLKSESMQALRDRFLRSAEFALKCRLHGATALHPLDLPKLEIDTDASAAELAAGVAKIRAAWEHLGYLRPHFSVLTNPKFLPENLGGTIEQFWSSGEAEAVTVERILERQGFSPLTEKVCVEYGCGVGRVSMGLARRFKLVHGYDISPGHLAHAEQRAREMGMENLHFHRCSEKVIEDLERCDFFYSRIVFQHNPPPIIVQLVRKALRALSAGGIAVFQVPTYASGYRFKTAEWLNTEHPLDMQMHCLPQQRIFELIEEEGCILLEVREDNSTGEGFLSNTFITRKREVRWPIARLLRGLSMLGR